jgi:hypothetical protein
VYDPAPFAVRGRVDRLFDDRDLAQAQPELVPPESMGLSVTMVVLVTRERDKAGRR